MARNNYLQNNFTSGEVSPRIDVRSDLVRYRNGVKRLENLTIMPQGGVTSRMGTVFAAEVKDSSKAVELLDFQANEDNVYAIELGNLYARFYKDTSQVRLAAKTVTGVTKANPAVVTSAAHGYSNGDHVYFTVTGMTELNNRRFTVANVTANTFELSGINSTSFGTFTAGTVQKVYEVTMPYLEAQLPDVRKAQSVDVMYMCHGSHAPRELSRFADTNWTVAKTDFTDGPYLERDTSGITLSLSSTSGTVTVTASSALFAATDTSGSGGTGDSDRLLRIQDRGPNRTITAITKANPAVVTAGSHAFANGDRVFISGVSGMTEVNGKTYTVANVTGTTFELEGIDSTGFTTYTSGGNATKILSDWIWLKITGYTSPTVVTAAIQDDASFTATSVFNFFRLGAWSTTTGYPELVTFFENRAIYAKTATQPDTLWGSKSDDFVNFTEGTADDDAFSYTLLSEKNNAIQWISPQRTLRIGTTGAEFNMSGGSTTTAITPTNVRITRETSFGSKFIDPILVESATLFLQRTGRKVREFVFSFDIDGFVAPDISLISEHLTNPSVKKMAYQSEPDGIVWAVRTDGVLLGLTYMRDQDVIGWHKHVLRGTDVSVESLTSIPAETQDRVWLSVKRTINGTTKRYIERIGDTFDSEDTADAVILDSSFSYSGTATNTITGLYHLEGETISVLTDGGTHPDVVVTNGTITLNKNYETVHAGYGYSQILETLAIEAGSQIGSSVGNKGRITQIILSLFKTVGFKIGKTEATAKKQDFRKPSDLQDVGVPLFTGEKDARIEYAWEDKNAFIVIQDQPLPFTLLGYVAKVESTDAP